MTDLEDNPDLASDLSTIAMNIIKSSDPDVHGGLQEAFSAALAPLEAENQRLRATLSAITATDCYSRDECTDMARAALNPEANHDD